MSGKSSEKVEREIIMRKWREIRVKIYLESAKKIEWERREEIERVSEVR